MFCYMLFCFVVYGAGWTWLVKSCLIFVLRGRSFFVCVIFICSGPPFVCFSLVFRGYASISFNAGELVRLTDVLFLLPLPGLESLCVILPYVRFVFPL